MREGRRSEEQEAGTWLRAIMAQDSTVKERALKRDDLTRAERRAMARIGLTDRNVLVRAQSLELLAIVATNADWRAFLLGSFDEDDLVRVCALEGFALYDGNKALIARSIACLKDPYQMVRRYASEVVSMIAKPDVAKAVLLEHLAMEKVPNPRVGCLYSLYRLTQNEEFLRELVEIASRDDGDAKYYVGSLREENMIP